MSSYKEKEKHHLWTAAFTYFYKNLQGIIHILMSCSLLASANTPFQESSLLHGGGKSSVRGKLIV